MSATEQPGRGVRRPMSWARGLTRIAIPCALLLAGVLLGARYRATRPLQAGTEQRVLAGQFGLDPRRLHLEQQKGGPCHTCRVWSYDYRIEPGAHFRTFDGQLRRASFHERLPRVRTAGAWSGPLQLVGAPTWTGAQRRVSSSVSEPLTSDARDLGLLALGAVLGLVATDSVGRNLCPTLDWTGVPTEYPSGHPHFDVTFEFQNPPPGVPGHARCSLILDTAQVDSVETWGW